MLNTSDIVSFTHWTPFILLLPIISLVSTSSDCLTMIPWTALALMTTIFIIEWFTLPNSQCIALRMLSCFLTYVCFLLYSCRYFFLMYILQSCLLCLHYNAYFKSKFQYVFIKLPFRLLLQSSTHFNRLFSFSINHKWCLLTRSKDLTTRRSYIWLKLQNCNSPKSILYIEFFVLFW